MKKGDSITFISFALGLLIASFSFSLAPLISTWYRLPLFVITLLVAWGAIWQTTGSLLSGRLSDKFGRRGSYKFDIICMLIGITVFIISRDVDIALLGLAFILVGTGGEYSAISAATHEMFSSRFRGTAMLLELDFVNIGGTLSALTLILLVGASIVFQRLIISAFILAVVAFIVVSRFRVSESGLWVMASESKSELSGPTIRYRLFTAIAIGISEALGFNLIVYGLGPYYFPGLT
ncbi:MAG: MFS transporter, partial [Nitrososphaerota archaeon]|nr:MFS transporter [Nitrososphaerota archaeon]